MRLTISDLQLGEEGIIKDISSDLIPLKLLEMGCLPGNKVQLVQVAPFNDPLYLIINDCHLAIRKDTAQLIEIEKM
ncbi:ferrous iron transport protein A [Sungkyunkwania multivorans]|uniref:Ferrous iron transport protein A n=1 Tax=Sungkyunkwania multivorans TaxID=1173618 RepID=A0ABW3CZ50_9FLAO